MVAEEVIISLSGSAPWGFRLQGGAEHHRPLQVAKVRRRSKACRAGLREDDELVAIDDRVCEELSHAQAMSLIDSPRATLNLRVKRAPSGFHSVAVSGRPPPPRSSMRALSFPLAPLGGPGCLTSPPDSEAYYGETDSDADTHTQTPRRQRRPPPHVRSPGRHDSQQEEEETSEMSGYESAQDGGVSLQGQWENPAGFGPVGVLSGVPWREVVYQPPEPEWTPPSHPSEQAETVGGVEGEGEGDSGFQEAGGCVRLACPPLVCPERAKEALMLGSHRQLVPMVGPQQTPISDELSTTYRDKARLAKLQRGESVVEKQVKEARTKCRSIASLLTDAPDPHSKGVLMFKKRRQRAKKYTLTCFGRAEGETGGETEGETGGEEEEEGRGSSFPSGSEVDEEGFSAAYDPTWDSGYLDMLDRRSSACPYMTPANNTQEMDNPTHQGSGQEFPAYQNSCFDNSTYQSPGMNDSTYQSPGLNNSNFQRPEINNSIYQSPGMNNSTYQIPVMDIGSEKQPVSTKPAHNSSPRSPVALTNGSPVGVSRASVLLSPSSKILLPDPNSNSNPHLNPDPNIYTNPIPGGVMNRTARPFTPGPAPTRSHAAPVVFHPPQPAPQTRPKPTSTPAKPTAAVSMMTIPPPHSFIGPEARRAVSSTSLYIAPRPNTSAASSPPPVLSPPPILSPPPLLSPPSSLASAPFSIPPGNLVPFSPPSSVHAATFSPPYTPLPPSSARAPVYPSSAVASHPFPPLTHVQPCAPTSAPPFSPPSSTMSAPPPPHTHTMPPPTAQPPLSLTFNPYINMTTPMTPVTPATPMAAAAPPQSSDSLASREQRISVPASRTGILQEARRRSNKKPMFSAKEEKKDVSPNPALLSLLQNLDDQTESGLGSVGPGGPGAGVETGVESGPEEDWLRLGAEACNFMQAQRGPKPPPVAPKPHVQAPQVPQLGGKGGQLFARRQSRMDRYVVDRAPTSYSSPARPREPSPTPSLPATWKYSSNIRAPPPISYNPLLSPSCPTQAQKPKAAEKQAGPGFKKGGAKAQKGGIKAVDIMSHQPYQLNSSLFIYGGGTPQTANSYQQQPGVKGSSQGPMKTARVYEVKRFSTPPPSGLILKVIAPRSATTLGEPLYRSDATSPPLTPAPAAYQLCQPQPQWASSPQSPLPPPAPAAPLPQLPILSSTTAPIPIPAPYVSPSAPLQANRQFKSAPDLSQMSSAIPRPSSSSSQTPMVPRPRFSTSNLGLKPHIWRPGPTMH